MSKRVFDIIFKTKGLGKATSGLKGLGRGLGGLVKGTALAGAGIAALSLKLAGDFQKSLKEVGTLMGGMTDRQMKDMSRELRALSQSSGLALSSLAKAKYFRFICIYEMLYSFQTFLCSCQGSSEHLCNFLQ